MGQTEKQREYDRSEKRKAYKRALYQKNKEKILQKNKISRERNREYFENYNKKRNEEYKTKGKMYERAIKRGWKDAGIIFFDSTFENYKNAERCEFCNCEFSKIGGRTTKNKKCLDHDHLCGYARFIICFSCNIKNRETDNLRMKLHLELHRYFNII